MGSRAWRKTSQTAAGLHGFADNEHATAIDAARHQPRRAQRKSGQRAGLVAAVLVTEQLNREARAGRGEPDYIEIREQVCLVRDGMDELAL